MNLLITAYNAQIVLTKDALYRLSYRSIFDFFEGKVDPHFDPHGNELK